MTERSLVDKNNCSFSLVTGKLNVIEKRNVWSCSTYSKLMDAPSPPLALVKMCVYVVVNTGGETETLGKHAGLWSVLLLPASLLLFRGRLIKYVGLRHRQCVVLRTSSCRRLSGLWLISGGLFEKKLTQRALTERMIVTGSLLICPHSHRNVSGLFHSPLSLCPSISLSRRQSLSLSPCITLKMKKRQNHDQMWLIHSHVHGVL